MSPPPTSIDGTDITGATIDGQEVQEITIDGETVFSAEQLPVAYGNLVGWFPFDSSFYGGANADDVTALFNPSQSGDSVAYDGIVTGATFQSTAGVTDINAGANSGAYNFDGNDDDIEMPNTGAVEAGDFTVMLWAKYNTISTADHVLWSYGSSWLSLGNGFISNNNFNAQLFDNSNNFVDFGTSFTGTFAHHGMSFEASTGTMKGYLDGVLQGSVTTNGPGNPDPKNHYLGSNNGRTKYADAQIDDFRIYNTVLSDQQFQDIVNNTAP